MSSLDDANLLATWLERARNETVKAERTITSTQARVLLAIMDCVPATHAHLVSTLGCDKAQVSKAVSALIAKGLVTAFPSTRHKRQSDLILSSSGQMLVLEMLSGVTENGIAKFVDMIGTNGKYHLRELAQLLRQAAASDRPASKLTLRIANTADLLWLLGQFERSPKGRGAIRSLLEHMHELFEHLHYCESLEHRWVLENWGQRIGGAILTYDQEATQNAWIKLLYVKDLNREAIGKLVRQCVTAAEQQTYELVQVEIPQEATLMREVLSEVGFKPVKLDVKRSVSGELKLLTWGLQLLPPLDATTSGS